MSDESIRFEDAMAAQHAELEADRNLWKKLAHDGGVLVAALRARIADQEAIITGLNTEIRLRGERIAELEQQQGEWRCPECGTMEARMSVTMVVANLEGRISEREATIEIQKKYITKVTDDEEVLEKRIAKLETVLRRGRQIRIGLPGDTQTVRQTDFHAYMRDIDAALEEQR